MILSSFVYKSSATRPSENSYNGSIQNLPQRSMIPYGFLKYCRAVKTEIVEIERRGSARLRD